MTENHEEILLGRVVDRDDLPGDWDELERAAASDPWLWQRLARSLREQSELRHALEPVLAGADGVDLPRDPDAHRLVGRDRARGWLGRSGWIAATFMACALVAVLTRGGRTPAAGPAAAARETARESLPPVVVDARPASSGDGFEVLLLHRALEHRVVPALFEVGVDDHGDPVPVPVSRASLVGTRGF